MKTAVWINACFAFTAFVCVLYVYLHLKLFPAQAKYATRSSAVANPPVMRCLGMLPG